MSFDRHLAASPRDALGLNPFRAGRCLSTDNCDGKSKTSEPSQSLSSRAMSFDEAYNSLIAKL